MERVTKSRLSGATKSIVSVNWSQSGVECFVSSVFFLRPASENSSYQPDAGDLTATRYRW